jgi:membrane-bound lytic murein transglycosylase F
MWLLTKDNISVEKVGIGMLLVGSILISSCFNTTEPEVEAIGELSISVTEPIYRDLAEIKRSGVLRMITSYSSGSYFLHRGIQVGFEYELVREYAKENDLALEVIIAGPDDNPYDLLYEGVGDVIAASYTITEEREELVSFTRPYNLVNQIIVVSDEAGVQPSSISDLENIPLSIRRNSSYFQTFEKLREEGVELDINLVNEELDTEAILFQVANGIYEATIADDHIFYAANKYMDGLIEGPRISERDEIAWAIRPNGPDLENSMNQFLRKHFRYSQDGSPRRSAFLNILRKRYFEESTQIADYFSPEIVNRTSSVISPYDSLFQVVADEFDLDWLMLTAIAAQESKFDPSSVSWMGAVGLMQVLPRFSEISEDSLMIAEVSAREGARIIKDHLQHYSYMDTTNQWKFALATYNAGLGHLADARRLSIDRNDNPNEWQNISDSLLKLMQRRYYQHARYGFCRGIETVRYVNEITNRYETYQAILEANDARNDGIPGIMGIKTLN